MCSSVGISLLAACSHAATWSFVKFYRPPNDKSYLLFCQFYFVMEVFQAVQWTWGDVNTCNFTNQSMTFIAYILIWWQPYLFVQMGRVTGLRLTYARNFSLFVFAFALALLGYGMMEIPTYNLPTSNFANITCTKVGAHGHLGWEFSPKSVVYGPTFFVYFATIINTIYFYPRHLQMTIGMGWGLTLFMSMALVGTSVDLPAFWCLLSVFVDLPILIKCYYHRRK